MASIRLLNRLFVLVMVMILPAACSLTTGGEPATPVPTAAPAAELPTLPLVYYYFASLPGNTFPAGSVVIVPDVLILSPVVSDIPRSADPAANVHAALQAMIQDPRNVWTSSDLALASVTVSGGQAVVVLSGQLMGAGDVVLIAARMQILMTIFAESTVQTAVVTLNGDNIGNLGISHSSESKPADYAYTRSEIETFMAENALNG
jgi:hypothetical protein